MNASLSLSIQAQQFWLGVLCLLGCTSPSKGEDNTSPISTGYWISSSPLNFWIQDVEQHDKVLSFLISGLPKIPFLLFLRKAAYSVICEIVLQGASCGFLSLGVDVLGAAHANCQSHGAIVHFA